MIATAALLHSLAPTDPCRDRTVFWVEVAGIVSFALYWFFKTAECALHDTDRRIPDRRRPREALPAPAAPSGARPKAAPVSEFEHWKSLWRQEDARL